MKFFERDGKFNWVDINNVFVGFDSYACCCEDYGYFYSYQIPIDLIEEDDPNKLNNPDLDPYSFNQDFFKQDEFRQNDWNHNEKCTATFKLEATDKPDIYLTIYNYHNGYYGHGFNFGIENGEIIKEGIL